MSAAHPPPSIDPDPRGPNLPADGAAGSARSEFWTGVRDELPLQLGVVPFGLVFGVLGIASGLTPLQTILMSSILFGGASQVVFAQLWATGAPPIFVNASSFGDQFAACSLQRICRALSSPIAARLAHRTCLSSHRRSLCRQYKTLFLNAPPTHSNIFICWAPE